MKKLIIVAIAGLAFNGILPRSAMANEVKIGIVDMPKALQSVEAGKKAKSQLEKEAAQKRKAIQDEDAALKKMAEEFKKQSLVMSDDARAKKQAELQERFAKFQEMQARAQMELQQKEQELVQPIVTKLKTIISELAKQKGFTVVLEKNENNVLYSQEKDEFTNDVVGAYNKQAKSS